MWKKYLKIKATENTTRRFINKYGIVKTLRECGFRKEKGIGTFEIMLFLMSIVFTCKNLYRKFISGEMDFGKDVIYRMLNSPQTNWRKFLLKISYKAYKFTRPLTSENREECFVLDDTAYNKNRSKKLELLAKKFDHTTMKYYNGFSCATVGWTDGNTFLPIGFDLMSSQDDKNIKCDVNAEIDKRTCGYKARVRSRQSTLEVAENLIKQALSVGINAQYLLMDSWFSFASFIQKIVDLKLNVICGLKDLKNQFYIYNDKKYTLGELFKTIEKSEFHGTKNIYFATVKAELVCTNETTIPIKITFLKTKGKKREWFAIGSTNTEISEEEITRIYGKRWSIEVFFKTAKSDLKLAKEFQGRSFDMLCAHTTIVFLRYIMLAVEARSDCDDRSIGGLFYLMIDELADIKLDESLEFIINSMFNAMGKTFNPTDDNMRDFSTAFIGSLPSHLREKFIIQNCES